MKKIIVLNGSPRKNGNTTTMMESFVDGAKSAGNQITQFDIQEMNIHPCIGCMQCMNNVANINYCALKDDMSLIYDELSKADVIVFVSPVRWWGPSSQLKCVIDRLEGYIGHYGIENLSKKETALLMTYAGGGKVAVQAWYSIFSDLLGCKDLGFIIGVGTSKNRDAWALGKSIC